MHKNQLQELLSELGVQADVLLLKLVNQFQLSPKRIKEMIKSQWPSLVSSYDDVRPGMFVIRNGGISKTYVADEVVALVLGCKSDKILALSITGKEHPFSSTGLNIDTLKLDGLEATRRIVDYAQRNQLCAEAAEFCQNFSIEGLIKKGDAFLLSLPEMRRVQSYFYNIREAFREVGLRCDCLWSSTLLGCDESRAFVCSLCSADSYQEFKRTSLMVYPAFWLPFKEAAK